MSILWILAKHGGASCTGTAAGDAADATVPSAPEIPVSLANYLIGDYAVRAVASLTSLSVLLRLNRSQWPEALVIDGRSAGWLPDDVEALLKSLAVDLPVIQVSQRGLPAVPFAAGTSADAGLPSHWFHCTAVADGLGLSAYIAFVLACGGGRRQRDIVRYRTVLLDCARRQCLTSPDAEPVSLPHKEAQLLRLLLERAGVCLSRQTIQKEIWAGVKVTPRTIDSHVSRLRRRLEPAAIEIQSVYGGGYLLR